MNGDLWAVGRLRPSRVVGAFGCPFEDFAFDHPWVGAGAACWIEALGEFPDGALPEGGDSVTVVRGKKSCGTTIVGDTQRRDKGYSIGVVPGVRGGVEHERADGVMAA